MVKFAALPKGEFAPGLPDKKRFDRISQKGQTRLIFQRHKATSDHYDMRLQDGDIAHSWVTRSLPGEKDKMLAIRQPTHTAEYMDFEGNIPKGYGAGDVEKVYDENVEVVKADNKRIKVVLPDGEWTMMNLKGNDDWLMVKNKHTIKNPITTKPKYKDLKEKELDPNDDTKVWQPKVDGAHTVFRLNSNNINRVYSYRNRKDDNKPIEHTHQVPTIRDASVPTELDGVEVRGELYAKEKSGKPMEAQDVTGILNSKPIKSLEQQGLKGNLLPYLFSVTKWKGGKNVEKANYSDQIKMLKEIENKVGPLRMAETADTPEQKMEMYNAIKNKTHPDTVEGIVQWDLESSGGNPEKKKIRETHEVVIREIYPAATPKTGRKMAGGFGYSWTPKGPVVGKVGTGFKEKMRKEMLKDPEKFINRIARIKTQQVFKSGASRAPSFYQMHVEKNLEKVAKTKLQEHQERVLNKLEDEDAVLVYHGLGSGKTLTSLAAGDRFNLPVGVVGPAALKHNFPKEKAIHGIKSDVEVSTYNKPISSGEGKIVVFDEAHRMGRAESQRSRYPEEIKGDKTLFMTGTPIRNHPSELAPIMRGLGIDVSRDKKAFGEKFIEEIKIDPGIMKRIFMGIKPGVEYKIKNKEAFKKLIKGKVDYYNAGAEGYPEVSNERVEVVMTPEQNKAYEMALKGNPGIRYKIRHGVAPSKTESKNLNAFMTATRQISNSPADYNLKATKDDEPKIKAAVQEILRRYKEDKNYRGVTYSNYLKSGVNLVSDELGDKIPHALFTGKQSDKEKKRIIEDYNKGDIKQLLISGAGAEGLDLRGTKLMQILEPHWNDALLDQVKGRAIRYKSHEHLPKEERKVDIQEFASIPRKRGLIFKSQDIGADDYLSGLSEKKSLLNKEFLDAMKEASEESIREAASEGWGL